MNKRGTVCKVMRREKAEWQRHEVDNLKQLQDSLGKLLLFFVAITPRVVKQ